VVVSPHDHPAYHSWSGYDEYAIGGKFLSANIMMDRQLEEPDDVPPPELFIPPDDTEPRRTIHFVHAPELDIPLPVPFADKEQDKSVRGDLSDFLGVPLDGDEGEEEKDELKEDEDDCKKEDEDRDEEVFDDEDKYWPPRADIDPRIRRNRWTSDIAILRRIRRNITDGIRLLAQLLLTLKWRDHVDACMGDIKHYFYHHCHIFRYLDNDRQVLNQGFYFNCIHLDYTAPTPVERKPMETENPLITAEEEEFLTQAANILEVEQRGELVNTIRNLMHATIPLPDHARLLFESSYLDPTDFTDSHGRRRAIVWAESDL
jgi:hypothetical protein